MVVGPTQRDGADGHSAVRTREGSVLGTIHDQLVKDQGDRLGLRRSGHDVGPANRSICVGRVRRKLMADGGWLGSRRTSGFSKIETEKRADRWVYALPRSRFV